VCCINYSNALDSAEHFKIGNITDMGVLVCLIVLIQDIYTKQEGKVEFEQDITKWFPIQKGVRQGCVIWPFLIYRGSTLKEHWGEKHGSRCQNRGMKNK
jgi:hypothetical protein